MKVQKLVSLDMVVCGGGGGGVGGRHRFSVSRGFVLPLINLLLHQRVIRVHQGDGGRQEREEAAPVSEEGPGEADQRERGAQGEAKGPHTKT